MDLLDFIFAFLGDVNVARKQRRDILLKGKKLLLNEQIHSLIDGPILRRNTNENGRVASPELLPINLKGECILPYRLGAKLTHK